MGHGVQQFQAGWRALGVVLALGCAQPASAEPQVTIGAPVVVEELRPTLDGNEALSAEDLALIEKALAPDTAVAEKPAKPFRLPGFSGLAGKKGLDLSRTDRADGSGTVSFKKPLVAEWDASIGADLGLAADSGNAPITYSRDNPLGVTRNDRSTGAAWASVGVASFASVDARVDQSSDQGRLGTTFKQSLPVGDKAAISLQSRYSVTESLGTARQTSDIPLRVAPVNDPSAPAPRVWGNENVAKLDILNTGTTLAAGLTTTSADPVTHNTLSAEQKIFGPLGLATTVTDIGRASESKSLSARLKLTW